MDLFGSRAAAACFAAQPNPNLIGCASGHHQQRMVVVSLSGSAPGGQAPNHAPLAPLRNFQCLPTFCPGILPGCVGF